jgi:hypothetical protein
MISILYATLFAACASAANITTSIWIPGAASANQTFLGSVVQTNGDNTIMSLSFANPPTMTENEYFYSAPAMVTIAGTTRVAYNVSGSDPLASSAPTVTVQLDCQRSSGGISAVPTCTLSTQGANPALSGVCAGLTVTSLPEYCTASDAQTFDQTMTLSGELQYHINNFQLIITAGTEKLGASAAATPSASSVSVTGVAGGNGTTSGAIAAGSRTTGGPAASGSGTNGDGAAASRTSAGASGSPQQASGAAMPMRSVAPALVGLGAAAAAFFL